MGKGATSAAAITSALMEALERAAAERPPEATCRGSFRDMSARGLPVADPRHFTLPPDTGYDPDAAIFWSRGFELASGAETWLATDLVVCPPADGVLLQPDTNGLASGNTRIEAILHALCELIERDASSRVAFADAFAEPGDGAPEARALDPATAPSSCRPLVNAIATAGFTVLLHDLTQEILVPTIRAMIVEDARVSTHGAGRQAHFGLGCAPSAELAVRRAVTEAVQSRLASIQGARDSFNRLLPSHRAVEGLRPERGADFATVPTFESDDIADDLRHVLACLAAAGRPQAIAVALTRREFDVPVVRVRVPGLSQFLVDRSRVGWRELACLL